MNDIIRIPCVIMRGGTSKGVYLNARDLPTDPVERDRAILAVFGSPDVRQIDGLGGADALTSKVAIIAPASTDGADIDYTFGQVSMTAPYVDYSGNCGNISSGVGPFAVDEGLVRVFAPMTRVRIHNTNTGKILVADVLVENGRAQVAGNCRIAGVPGTGARIMLDFAATAGAKTGKLLPTGNTIDVIDTIKGSIEGSIVDCGNPVVFVRAAEVGAAGTETPAEIDGNAELLRLLEDIRAKVAVTIGMAADIAAATEKSPAFPMIAMVRAPTDYTDFTSGGTIQAQDVSLVSRMMFMQKLHKTYPGTGTVCTGAAAKINGTIVNEVIPGAAQRKIIRIGHPAGVIEVEAAVKNGKVTRAAFARTARRIMDGHVYVKRR